MLKETFKLIGKVTFDISEFNKACNEEGLEPFPLQSYDLEVQDEDHFRLSVSLLQDRLAKWWESQKEKKTSSK
jgi:hypothetical protein